MDMTDRELLELLVNEIKEIKSDVGLIKTQQSEHGEILQSVRHAQESQKAQMDQLTYASARVEGRQETLDKTVDRMAGDISFLVKKAAEHEDDIRELRKASM